MYIDNKMQETIIEVFKNVINEENYNLGCEKRMTKHNIKCLKEYRDEYSDEDIMELKSSITRGKDNIKHIESNIERYNKVLKTFQKEENYKHCEECSNYNIGDGYDDISVNIIIN